MLRTLIQQIKAYKTASIMTPVWTAAEVVMDVLIPYVTASLIDKGISAGSMENVYLYGAVMIGMAFLSLGFGILAGRSVAYAASGFAANLRKAMFRNIQRFAFSDIDKYSTSGLVTRMTTDVNSLQNAYQQILRITVRAPFRLVLSIVMCLIIDARLSLIFIVAMVVLSLSLYQIISRVARLFQQVFVKYDDLNQSVQENIQAIRVVKAFVREDYENEKFAKAAEGLYKLYVRAESLMALNHPIMNLVVYGCIIALSWWGSPLHRRRHADHRRTDLTLHLRDVNLAIADDAVDDLRDADAERSLSQARQRDHRGRARHREPRTSRLRDSRRQRGVPQRQIRLCQDE